VLVGGGQFGTCSNRELELSGLLLAQRVRMAGEPAGHLTNGRWSQRRFGGCLAGRESAGGPVPQGGVADVDSPLVEFALEVFDHHVAGLPPLPQVVGVRVEDAGAAWPDGDLVLPAGGAGIPLHGVPSPAKPVCDRADAYPRIEQVMDLVPTDAGECAGAKRETSLLRG